MILDFRSPAKHPQYSAYSTFSPSKAAHHPVSYITSPASTNTGHTLVSMPPPLPPAYPSHTSVAGGSVIGVSTGSPSPSPHPRQPIQTNDLYAVVSKPSVVFRNGITSASPVPNFHPPMDTNHMSKEVNSFTQEHVPAASHVTYIMDRDNNATSHSGTHV